jgi:putative FmdB family regulatory protein
MPIYDYKCQDCGEISEIFLHGVDNAICCKPRQERQVKLAVAKQNAVKRRHALQVIFVRGGRK